MSYLRLYVRLRPHLANMCVCMRLNQPPRRRSLLTPAGAAAAAAASPPALSAAASSAAASAAGERWPSCAPQIALHGQRGQRGQATAVATLRRAVARVSLQKAVTLSAAPRAAEWTVREPARKRLRTLSEPSCGCEGAGAGEGESEAAQGPPRSPLEPSSRCHVSPDLPRPPQISPDLSRSLQISPRSPPYLEA